MVPVVPCPVVVGRAAELDILARALNSARDGHGALVFIVGEAGIGKSRMVQEVAASATNAGMTLLRGRAVPGSDAMAFRPLAEALAAAIPPPGIEGGDLAPWLPVLAALVPAPESPATEVTVPVLGEAILRLLRATCAPAGGLLVLEDLHWADPETLAVVEHLGDHLDRAPILGLVTVRSEEAGPAHDLVRRVSARRAPRIVELDRLNDAQVAAMVHNCTGGVDPDAVARVVTRADGVPFLVEEMLLSPGLPASLADAVHRRLAELPEPTRSVVVAAAGFGRHFDWRLLSAATGLDEEVVVDALERSVAAQLLVVEGDGFRFRHALTADAVFDSVSPPRRLAIAASALAALERAHEVVPAGMRDSAAQLAVRAGRPELAGELYVASGEEALQRGALHTAVVGLEQAVDLLPPGDALDHAQQRLVDALSFTGRVDDALRVGEQLVGRLPADRAAAVRLRLAGTAITASRWDTAARELSAARRLVTDTTPGHLRAELDLREGELAIGTNDIARAEARAHAALDLARHARATEVECAALQLLGRCARRTSLDAADAWFRRSLAVAEQHELGLWRLRALHEIGTIALLDDSAVDGLVEAQELAESLGAMATAAILDIELAAGYAGQHDLDRELQHGLAAVQHGTELGLDLVVAYGWHFQGSVAALRGDHEQAEAAAAAARAAAPGNRDIEGLASGGVELVDALVADDAESALAAAERCAALLRGSQTAPPMHTRAAWPLLLAVDHLPAAPAALEELEQSGLVVNRGGRGGLTMARAVIAGWDDPDRAARLAVEADEQLAHLPWWRHVVRRHAAAAAAADGWEIPHDWLRDSERWLRDHGFVAIAQACAALRRGAPATVPPAWVRLGVTRREADVLALVIEGHSNRDIAERLFLSVRTVEKHVEALLRKTGATTRTQLARVAATT